jgi:Uma2 family endonuclease
VSMGTTSKVIPVGSVGASPSQGPVEFMGPFAQVPPLHELERLTEVPDRRVVFRGVDWAFYDKLVDSIPETSNIHVDFDGKDVEVMGKRRRHENARRLLRQLIEAIARESAIAFRSAGETTWRRPAIERGLEADECYYFLPEKIAADVAALKRKSDEIADYPNPDLAVEVDLSPPQIDRAGIYAALKVAEVWRFDGKHVVIEQLAPDGSYHPADSSLFLPVRAEDIRRWIVDEDSTDETVWETRLRAEIRTRKQRMTNQS